MPEASLTDQSAELHAAIDRVGYYPAVVADAVEAALSNETVTSFVIHHDLRPRRGTPPRHRAGADTDPPDRGPHR
jgi:hypothetical protein